jgi:hypothetical protein
VENRCKKLLTNILLIMDKLKLKKALVEECLRRHRQNADDYESAMSEAQQNANDYGNPEDWFDTYKSDLLTKRDLLSIQLTKVRDEIKVLERISLTKETDVVGFGSIVITKDQKMFISIGLGKVEVEKQTFYAISPSVPIFVSMRDRKKGDTFEFREKKFKILDLF